MVDQTLRGWLATGKTEQAFDRMLAREKRCWWCYTPLEGDGTDRTFFDAEYTLVAVTHAKCGRNLESHLIEQAPAWYENIDGMV